MNNRQELLNDTDTIESLTFKGVEKTYSRVVMINTALSYLLIMTAPLMLMLFGLDGSDLKILIISECIFLAAAIINLIIASRACKYMGYALREKDITYRKGVFFHNIRTMPFSKIQQVSISQNPILRIFGLYSVELTNASAWLSSITIPGLAQSEAELLKQHITRKLNDAAK